MLAPLLSPVPAINIEFAAEQIPFKEPSSPFDNILFNATTTQDAYRSTHLLPPPVHSPKDHHIRPTQTQTTTIITRGLGLGLGLDPARFEALRAASKNAAKLNLRKELAIRAHQSKQIERRNLFLSKIEALPSPTAASLPVTPPESPAVFHFTLPSPGLISPLALFESLDQNNNETRPVRIEQVDFRSLARKEAEALAALTGNIKQSLQVHGLSVPPKERSTKEHVVKVKAPHPLLPSLDQISKRLGGNVTINRSPSPVSRLPAFLQRNTTSAATGVQAESVPTANHIFVPTGEHGPIARPTASGGTAGVKARRTPMFVLPSLVTLPGPRIVSTRAPTPLTAEALDALNDRAQRGTAMVERLQRRFSAPARMTEQQQRTNHPRVLARPVGGF